MISDSWGLHNNDVNPFINLCGLLCNKLYTHMLIFSQGISSECCYAQNFKAYLRSLSCTKTQTHTANIHTHTHTHTLGQLPVGRVWLWTTWGLLESYFQLWQISKGSYYVLELICCQTLGHQHTHTHTLTHTLAHTHTHTHTHNGWAWETNCFWQVWSVYLQSVATRRQITKAFYTMFVGDCRCLRPTCQHVEVARTKVHPGFVGVFRSQLSQHEATACISASVYLTGTSIFGMSKAGSLAVSAWAL